MKALSGTPEDWGLSEQKLSELDAELADHLACQQRCEGRQAADASRESLSKENSRRKLIAVHLTDQVYATLNRWPTRREWIELAWLLAWFALIVASDLLSLHAESAVRPLVRMYWHWDDPQPVLTGYPLWATTAAWLAQGIARGGFFACFFTSLWRAWKVGRGVWLARILQLKLIHTVLVVAAFFVLSEPLWNSNYQPEGWETEWPLWVSPLAVLGICLGLAAAVLLISRFKASTVALGMTLAALFLYAGAPACHEVLRTSRPIVSKAEFLSDGTKRLAPSDDLLLVIARGTRWQNEWECGQEVVDIDNNRWYGEECAWTAPWGTYWAYVNRLINGGG